MINHCLDEHSPNLKTPVFIAFSVRYQKLTLLFVLSYYRHIVDLRVIGLEQFWLTCL